MILTLQRKPQDPHSTPGSLAVDGIWQCFTMEPPASGVEFPRISAGGPWRITLRPSFKFQQIAQNNPWFLSYCDQMPHVEYKPESVTMLHPLNWPEQSHDCIGVGQSHDTDKLINSDAAFAQLFIAIQAGVKSDLGCWIEIEDAPNNSEDVQIAESAT